MAESNGTDGILDHENAEIQERVSLLERKVHEQDDEILCLKGALADLIRRMNTFDAGRVVQNNLLPSKFKSPMPPRKIVATNTFKVTESRRRVASVDQPPDLGPPGPGRRTPTPGTPGTPKPARSNGMKKWGSYSSTDFNNQVLGARSPNKTPKSLATYKQRGNKDISYDSEEGYVRMYLRGRPISLYVPSEQVAEYNPKAAAAPPNEKLKLEWVYGYRGRDCRSNLYLLPTGELVYFVAAVAVLYNVEEQHQRHYLGHNDDIKCLAIHPDKVTIATGQTAGHDKKAGRPHVRVWNSVSLQTLHVLGIGDFERSVCCVSFSKADGGQFLCAVDDANEHLLSVWDWQKGEKGHKIVDTKSSTEPVVAAEFHPSDKSSIVTCGKNSIVFWTFEGGSLGKKLGIFEKNDKPKFVLCVAFAPNGDVLTGDSNGNIFIWAKGSNKISRAILGAHDGGIFSLCFLKDNTLLSGGGKDRRIVHWGEDLQKTGKQFEIPEKYGPIRTLSQGKGNMVIVGTTRNTILQGTVDLEFNAIAQGHTDELWGLTTHPSQHQFLTAGYDKHVFLWDIMTHSIIWSTEVTDPAHCASIHPDGAVVALGTQSGRWQVLDMTTRDVISSHTDGNEQIECIEYSPDGNYVAVGSRDNFVYVYGITDEGKKYNKIGKCSGHTSFITHLDWSADNEYIRTNSGDYELLYWKSSTCRQVTDSSSFRDVEWATHYCTIAYGSLGIWPEGADGTDVNGCCRSHDKQLMASADDFGKVNLYTHPCSQPKAAGNKYGGHSSHVTSVRFLHDDSRLLSTGGKDMAILQWERV